MTARDVLDGIKGRLAAATPGPWETMKSGLLGTRVVSVDGEWDGIIPDEFVTLVTPALRKPTDAEFIAAAPVDVARLTRAVEAVLGLHQQVEGYIFGAVPGAPPDYAVCSICFTDDERPEPWPCPTVAAIEAALGEAS